MESIGEFFKQVRETKGLTLDDVALKTRIHPDFLIALEEGNFTKLPDQVFAKGFVRSYARSLGLDEEDAMRRFEVLMTGGDSGRIFRILPDTARLSKPPTITNTVRDLVVTLAHPTRRTNTAPMSSVRMDSRIRSKSSSCARSGLTSTA